MVTLVGTDDDVRTVLCDTQGHGWGRRSVATTSARRIDDSGSSSTIYRALRLLCFYFSFGIEFT